VRVVPELRADARQLSASLDEDVLRAVDEDVRDGRVAEQRLDGTKPRDLPDDLLDDLLALCLAERRRLLTKKLADRKPDLVVDFDFVLDLLQRLEIEPLDETVVQVDLELIDRAQLVSIAPLRADGFVTGVDGSGD
jgi:hypothetical protein